MICGYTAQGLLNSVVGTTTYVQGTDYDAAGRVDLRKLGADVLRTDYVYFGWTTATGRGRLQQLKAGPPGQPSQVQDLTYDDVGNPSTGSGQAVLTITDAAAYGGSQTQSFSYDALDRLATAQATGGSYGTYAQRSYQYGNTGNLTSFEGSAYAYNDVAHKHGVTHIGGVQKYWYDQNGNATRRINGSQDVTLNYDAENRLTQVSNGVTASYTYDGDGNRVKAVVNGTTSVYVGAYYEVQSSTVKKYYYAGSVRVAENNGGVLHFLLTDHLGSTATTTDANGNRVTELRYYPYGDSARYNPGGQITTFRFTGQRWDAGTGLYFYNARWYDPLIGRFIQADTIVPEPGNPQALNRYSYVGNRPLNAVDSTGHAPQDPNDSDDNPAACGTDWCWQNRWYRAHGYQWNSQDGRWTSDAEAHFYDPYILIDLLTESNVYIGTNWEFGQLSTVGMGIADLAKKVGGTQQLSSLLYPGYAKINRKQSGSGNCIVGCTTGSTIEFYDLLFTYSTQQIKDVVVHELAHVIDHKSAFRWGPLHDSVQFAFGYDTQDPLISNYAQTNWSEYWAEAVGHFVYGNNYYQGARGRGPINDRQRAFMIRALMGTGW